VRGVHDEDQAWVATDAAATAAALRAAEGVVMDERVRGIVERAGSGLRALHGLGPFGPDEPQRVRLDDLEGRIVHYDVIPPGGPLPEVIHYRGGAFVPLVVVPDFAHGSDEPMVVYREAWALTLLSETDRT
jgi:hypothetical protein